MVLNIESSATASGENAYEVLKKAPNVNVDKDENININGKKGVTILINDRPTHLSGNDLANYLKSVQGSEIEKVEIINTPPARYEAAGNTGVINIKIKKNNRPGLNGSINAGISYNDKVQSWGGVNLNLRSGKTNVYASFTPGSYAGKNTNNIVRDFIKSANNEVFDQNSGHTWRYNANSFKAGLDYEINKNNVVGFMVNGYVNSMSSNLKGKTLFYAMKTKADSSIGTHNTIDNSYNNMSYNLNYRATLDTSGRTLNVDIDYGQFNNDGDTYNNTDYYNMAGEISRPSQLLRNSTPATITIKSAKVDYEHPFNKIFKMELGAKGSLVKTDNNLHYDVFSSNVWQNDPTRSNHFVYDENILAGYVSFALELNKLSIKGGLRGENTWSKGDSKTDNKVVKRTYFDLFPTFFAQQKLNDNNTIGLSYNYRIDRPDYKNLNPFRYYLDEYTYQVGNPFLNPQYTHNISVNYAWKYIFFSEFTYTHTQDVMVEYIEQDEATKIGYQTTKNFSSLNSWSWTNSVNLSPTKWYRTNISGVLNNNSYENKDASGNINLNKLSYMVNMMNTFMLPKKYVVELSGWYQSAMTWGVFEMEPMWRVSVGIQKKFFNDKAQVKLSVDDIFDKGGKMNAKSEYLNIKMQARNTWSSQRIGLSFSYRFGKDLKPSRQRNTGIDDVQKRINSGK